MVNWKTKAPEGGPFIPFIDCQKTGIPSEVVHRALLLAMHVCDPCTRCKGSCTVSCGRYLEAQLGVIDRYIRAWDKKDFVGLHKRLTAEIQMRLVLHAKWIVEVMDDAQRPPEHRRPESEGFEMDHVEGWRRFNLLKTKGT